MKYWIDTEFIERPYAIDLISVGLGAEDGRELYAESSEVGPDAPAGSRVKVIRVDGAALHVEPAGA